MADVDVEHHLHPSDLNAGKNKKKPVPKKAVKRFKARLHVEGMLRRIEDAHRAGKRGDADYLTRQHLGSYDAMYTAALTAWRKLEKDRRPNLNLLPGIAERLNAWSGTDETVILQLKEKENNPNQLRTILDFGIENRALQHLLRPVLQVRADLHSSQYLLKGMHAAIKRVAALILEDYEWAIETDIKDCYMSFEGEKASDLLPIPKRVTLSSLLGRSLHLRMHPSISFGHAYPGADDYHFAQELADARRGFPQGSAASPLAVEMLLAPVFSQLPAAGSAIGYADNFLVMAKTENEAVSMTYSLWSALKAHPAGQLRPKEPKIFEPGKPIQFLGHRLRRHYGSVQIDPSEENRERFKVRMLRGLGAIQIAQNPKLAEQRAAQLRKYARSWTGAFQACTHAEHYRKSALMRIAQALQ
jgi:hypothetical protein